MNYTDIFLADLEREIPISRRVLQRVPDGRMDWKPHEKSMPMRYLAMMVATMPEWLGMVIGTDEIDIAPKDGPKFTPPPLETSADLVTALDAAVDQGPDRAEGDERRPPREALEAALGRPGPAGHAATRPDSRRRPLPLGPSPGPAHGLPEDAGGEGAVHLRTLRRRASEAGLSGRSLRYPPPSTGDAGGGFGMATEVKAAQPEAGAPSTDQTLIQLLTAAWATQAVSTAARLGIPTKSPFSLIEARPRA